MSYIVEGYYKTLDPGRLILQDRERRPNIGHIVFQIQPHLPCDAPSIPGSCFFKEQPHVLSEVIAKDILERHTRPRFPFHSKDILGSSIQKDYDPRLVGRYNACGYIVENYLQVSSFLLNLFFGGLQLLRHAVKGAHQGTDFVAPCIFKIDVKCPLGYKGSPLRQPLHGDCDV
ncbi:MAG: hypothetical protein A4E62_02252 [Syntrophorhabdus sp. PtaU1.Bin002]|nr:MAG: hypothetical protein A4E62_02252 [Syntrophorhabdus sp. PtaU1.Bin002]